MPHNDSLKATPSEVKKRTIEALLRERVGYERRLVAAEGLEDPDDRERANADAQRRIDEVNAQLRSFGHEGAPPARRSEKRPVSARAERR